MIVLNSPARGSAFLTVLMLAALSAGCTGSSRDESARPAAAAEPTSMESRRTAMQNEGKKMPPMRAPGEEAASVVQGSAEVPPELLAIFQDDLAQRAQVKHDSITVVSATEQQWSDAAMGCPQAGQMYAQMIVPGYRVVLQASGNRYAYHSDRSGNFVVCSNGLAFKPVKEQAKGTPPV